MDAAGFVILLGLFTAHMSGNSTGFGVALAAGDWNEALRRGAVIPLFVLATALGVAWIEGGAGPHASPVGSRDRAVAGVLLAEAILLAVMTGLALRLESAVTPGQSPATFLATAAAATTAMGLQNAALRRFGGLGVHTTFVTGMLTELAVGCVRWRIHRRRGEREDSARARQAAALAAIVWAAYVIGAIAGAWLVRRRGGWVISLPAAALLGMVGLLLRGPATSTRGR